MLNDRIRKLEKRLGKNKITKFCLIYEYNNTAYFPDEKYTCSIEEAYAIADRNTLIIRTKVPRPAPVEEDNEDWTS